MSAKQSTIPESHFMSALERGLNVASSPVRVDRINSGDLVYVRKGRRNRFRGARKGTGDFVGYVLGAGTHIEIEAKALNGKARKVQLARQAAAERDGWIYVSVRCGESLEASVEAALEAVKTAIRARFNNSKLAFFAAHPVSLPRDVWATGFARAAKAFLEIGIVAEPKAPGVQ